MIKKSLIYGSLCFSFDKTNFYHLFLLTLSVKNYNSYINMGITNSIARFAPALIQIWATMEINIFFKAWKNYVNDIIATWFDVELVHSICCPNTSSHFYFWALVADLVVDPARSLGVVALMTPTATVCRMSLAAKRPRGGKSEKASTHMGLLSTSLTIASSPDLMN